MHPTTKALLAFAATLALAACGKSSNPAEDSELTVMNGTGAIEGTINDVAAIETAAAPTSDAKADEDKKDKAEKKAEDKPKR